MKPDGEFEKLLRKKHFVDRVIAIVLDEAHCIMTWGKFRPEYKEFGRLRFTLTHHVPYLITSATLTPETFHGVMKVLDPHRKDDPITIQTYTDRPNIKLCVRKIKHPLASYRDLLFLVPKDWKPGDPAPAKFLVFFDNIQESILAAKTLQAHLPHAYHKKIAWFNSNMTTEYKETQVNCLRTGDIWGLCTTESFGMVSSETVYQGYKSWLLAGNGRTGYFHRGPVESDVQAGRAVAKMGVGCKGLRANRNGNTFCQKGPIQRRVGGKTQVMSKKETKRRLTGLRAPTIEAFLPMWRQ